MTSIFTFKDYISAIALLFVIYTITDYKYKFRISVAPIDINKIIITTLIFVGVSLLAIDFLLSTCANAILSNFQAGILQCLFAFIALTPAILCLYYMAIKPPKYSKFNYKKYGSEIYYALLNNSAEKLTIIADELYWSARRIVKHATNGNIQGVIELDEDRHAKELLLLISDKRLCKTIVNTAPATGALFFDEIYRHKHSARCILEYIKNIAREAILNENSTIHHEMSDFNTGLIGLAKPFSNSIYGDYESIELYARLNSSPFDIHTHDFSPMTANQLYTYTRCALITIRSYLKKENIEIRSQALHRIFDNIQNETRQSYTLNEINNDIQNAKEYKKIQIVSDFIREIFNLLETVPVPINLSYKTDNRNIVSNFYDMFAYFCFNYLTHASTVTHQKHHWHIQHNIVWRSIFPFGAPSKQAEHVFCRVRKLIFLEIMHLDEYSDFVSAHLLGLCLNVLGLKTRKRDQRDRKSHALQCALLRWVRSNFLRIHSSNLEIAKIITVGSISFDKDNTRLVKTYRSMPGTEPDREYFQLI